MIMDLRLAVKREYFEQIKSGEKVEEYRLDNEYWQKRISKGPFRNVIITLGYPKIGDAKRTITFPYVGWTRKVITHPHFGSSPVSVFAIKLTNNPEF